MTFDMLGIFLWNRSMRTFPKFTFLNYLFYYFIGSLLARLKSLFILQKSVVNWDRKLSQICFPISAAACLAPWLSNGCNKALSEVPYKIHQIWHFLIVMKSENSSSSLKNLCEEFMSFVVGLQYSNDLFKTDSNLISSLTKSEIKVS